MNLASYLILLNDLHSVTNLAQKIKNEVDSISGRVSRQRDREDFAEELSELRDVFIFGAGLCDAIAKARPASEPARPGVKLIRESERPEAISAGIPTIIYNDNLTRIVNGRLIDWKTPEIWYADLFGIMLKPESEEKRNGG